MFMPRNMIPNITLMTTCVSLYTPPCCKKLFLMQAWYGHKMGDCWFHCGWMAILSLHSWKQYHSPHTHHRIYYYTEKLYKKISCLSSETSSLHFTLCHHTGSSTGAKKTVMIWCILASQIFNLEVLGEYGRLRSVSHPNRISKMGFTYPCRTHYDTLSTYHCACFTEIMSHPCKNDFIDIFCFTVETTFIWPYIIEANNKCSLVG
jgi:hypothetical protein